MGFKATSKISLLYEVANLISGKRLFQTLDTVLYIKAVLPKTTDIGLYSIHYYHV